MEYSIMHIDGGGDDGSPTTSLEALYDELIKKKSGSV